MLAISDEQPTVYRKFDQAALNAEYLGSLSLDQRQEIFADWARRSAETRDRCFCACDIHYGSSAGETLDIFFGGQNHSPVQVFFHGGYWRSQDKSNFSFMAEPFVARGTTVVIVNYDLCPAVTVSEIVTQARRSIAWIAGNAHVFGSDPDRISVYGHSAGGQLVAALLETNWADYGAPQDVIKAGTAISGIFDLRPVQLTAINVDLRLSAADALQLSPLLRTPSRRVPFLVAVGAGETSELIRQSRDYVEVLKGRSVEVSLDTVEGCDHFEILDKAIDLDHRLGADLLRQALGTS